MAREFDIPYGLSNISITGTGNTVVSTKRAFYHGVVYVNTSTAPVTIIVYDHPSSSTGNVLDMIYVSATTGSGAEKFFPVIAKSGITISVSGVAGRGTVFYAPKG